MDPISDKQYASNIRDAVNDMIRSVKEARKAGLRVTCDEPDKLFDYDFANEVEIKVWRVF